MGKLEEFYSSQGSFRIGNLTNFLLQGPPKGTWVVILIFQGNFLDYEGKARMHI